MKLHGARYRRPGNDGLAAFILEELKALDLDETLEFYNDFRARPGLQPQDLALLACNDRFFLLTGLMNRRDMIHPWVFDRCREVEASPDEHIDLWAREHYKSTIITFGGAIQEICRDPDITIAIFSFTKDAAGDFVDQIKRECEGNDVLKMCFPDVFWWNPKGESPRWSVKEGLIFKRRSNPREATVEGHGLDAMPTGLHFRLRIYDDLVDRRNVTNELQIKKTNEGFELSDNLSGGERRRQVAGTRYHFADTYNYILEKNIMTPRIYPATDNGRVSGKPVLWDQATWDKKKIDQRLTLPAQLLLNPAAGNEAMFLMRSLRPWEVRPAILNVYITVDSSGGRTNRSDRTAIAVIGVDVGGNRYLLDGYCHRMKMSERWVAIRDLYKKWNAMPGVQLVKVGYERYSTTTDIEYLEERMLKEQISFPLEELAWPREGDGSKKARVSRLQPDFDGGKFFLPATVWHAEFEEALWSVPGDYAAKVGSRYVTFPSRHKGVTLTFQQASQMFREGKLKATGEYANERQAMDAADDSKVEIEYRPFREQTRAMKVSMHQQGGNPYLCARPIKRLDENKRIYDLTRMLFEEMRSFPFATHDDLVDVLSRLYDMEPLAPVAWERDTGLPEVYRDS